MCLYLCGIKFVHLNRCMMVFIKEARDYMIKGEKGEQNYIRVGSVSVIRLVSVCVCGVYLFIQLASVGVVTSVGGLPTLSLCESVNRC